MGPVRARAAPGRATAVAEEYPMPDPASHGALRRWLGRCVAAPVDVYRFLRWLLPRMRRTLLSLRHYDASTATTLRLFARNNWLKLRHWSLCCGNPGQPGC
jgi:hypothetical protein